MVDLQGADRQPGDELDPDGAETVLPMKDGLPKLKDFPAEFGGSGETVAGSTTS
mgnify:CR=1 FL=1